MIVDERIKTGRNRSAAGGFFITYGLLLFDLLYRQFYLKQTTADYWDIFLSGLPARCTPELLCIPPALCQARSADNSKSSSPLLLLHYF